MAFPEQNRVWQHGAFNTSGGSLKTWQKMCVRACVLVEEAHHGNRAGTPPSACCWPLAWWQWGSSGRRRRTWRRPARRRSYPGTLWTETTRPVGSQLGSVYVWWTRGANRPYTQAWFTWLMTLPCYFLLLMMMNKIMWNLEYVLYTLCMYSPLNVHCLTVCFTL